MQVKPTARVFYERWAVTVLVAAVVWIPLSPAQATVLGWQKISATSGGLTGPLEDDDRFGSAAVAVGDLDGDGLPEIAVGTPLDDTGGTDRGAVWILFPNADGTVRTQAKIDSQVGLGGRLRNGDAFGSALAAPGDLDGDGVSDLLVGAPFDDGAGRDRGAIWVLYLTSAGAVADHARIDVEALGGVAHDFDLFASSVAFVGELDGSSGVEIAVGAPGDDGDGANRGALWVLGWSDAGVQWSQRIAEQTGGFVGPLDDGDAFGGAIAAIEVGPGSSTRLAVGARYDDDGGANRGALWMLGIDAAGQVVSESKVSQTTGGFLGSLSDQALFGSAIALLGSDAEVVRLAVGASGDTGISSVEPGGTMWILLVDAGDQVTGFSRIRSEEGGFGHTLAAGDAFGTSLAALDLDGAGWLDLIVGAPGDDDGGHDHGATWFLPLDAAGMVTEEQKVSDLEGGLARPVLSGDRFGSALANLGDLDDDGIDELAVGAPFDDGDGTDRGTVWLLKLDEHGTVAAQWEVRPDLAGSVGALADGDRFGSSIASLGGGNLAIGAPGDDSGTSNAGAIWIARVTATGRLLSSFKIGASDPALTALAQNDEFGSAVAGLGDLDHDGDDDLAVGARYDDDGGANRGAVWILLLHPDGSVESVSKISSTAGSLPIPLDNFDEFGSSLASLGDLDGDGQLELAVGVPKDSDGFGQAGAVWVLSLHEDGTVAERTKISSQSGGFGGSLAAGYQFGTSVASAGDLDRDGLPELAVGTIGDDELGTERGSAWLLYLWPDGTVRNQEKLFDGEGVQTGPSYYFGAAVAGLGDVDGDDVPDLAVGATGADDGDLNAGAVWLLFLDGERSPRLLEAVATSRTSLRVRFSERMLSASVESESSYHVAPAGEPQSPVQVGAVGLRANGLTADLVLVEPLGERRYVITVSGVVDESGTPLAADAGSLEFLVPPLAFQLEVPARQYRGFGLSLEPFDPAAVWVLRALGDSNGDRNWRVSHWSPAAGAYIHVGSAAAPLTQLAPGQGYWIITRNPEFVQAGGFETPEGPFEIPLVGGPGDPESPAWNQIANPFSFPVRVSDLWIRHDDEQIPLTDVQNTWTSRTLRDGSTGAYEELGADQCLLPNAAAWIEKIAAGSVHLIVPDTAADGGGCAPLALEVQLPDAADWMIVLRATQDGIASEALVLGAADEALPATGLSTRVLPPRPDGSSPRLYVRREKAGRAERYARIFRTSQERMQWTIQLEAARAPGQIEMSAFTEGLDGVAYWRDDAAATRIRLDSHAAWTVAATASPRTFEVEVDRSGAAGGGSSTGRLFGRPYPNPFVASTGFRFRSPGPARLRVCIYDLAGRRVCEIAQRATGAGEQVLVWDGTDAHGRPVAAGAYLARQWIDGGPTVTVRVLKLR